MEGKVKAYLLLWHQLTVSWRSADVAMGGKFDSQLWFNAISDYTLHDYWGMTSNNKGQSCEALPSLLHSVENCFVFFFSFFFLFSRDRGRIPRLLRLFLFFLFERGDWGRFFLPRLPHVRLLAWCSAAWQFNVVPDRGRIRRLGQKVVPGPAATEKKGFFLS
jgi:hypothetical protein